MKTIKHGPDELRKSVNGESDTEVLVTTGAVTTALSLSKGTTILAPTGNTTGATLAAPTADMLGFRKLIANITAFSVVVTISGMARATQNVVTFVAAADAVIGPSLELVVRNISATATPSYAWVVTGAAGFVAGTSAVA